MQDFQHLSVLDRHQMNVSKALLGLQREIDLTICEEGNKDVTTECKTLKESLTAMINYEPTKEETFSHINFLRTTFPVICERVKDLLAGNEKGLIHNDVAFSSINVLADANYNIRYKLGKELCPTTLDAFQSLKLLENLLQNVNDKSGDDYTANCNLLNTVLSIISFKNCSIEVLHKVAESFNILTEEKVEEYSDFLCSFASRIGMFNHPGCDQFLCSITSQVLSTDFLQYHNQIKENVGITALAGVGFPLTESFGDILITIKDSLKSLMYGSSDEKRNAASTLNSLFYRFLDDSILNRGSTKSADVILNLIKTSWPDLKQEKFPMIMLVPSKGVECSKIFFLTDTQWDNPQMSDDRITISTLDYYEPDIPLEGDSYISTHIPIRARIVEVTKYFSKALLSDALVDCSIREDFLDLIRSPESNGCLVYDLINNSKIIFFDLSKLKRSAEFLKLNEYFND